MDNSHKQLPLFSTPSRTGGKWVIPLTDVPVETLTADSSLAMAAHWFDREMRRWGFAENTCKTYIRAVALLVRYLGASRPLSQIDTNDLRRFQAWVRGQTQSPKTAEINITAVRRFLLALQEAEILPESIANSIYPIKARKLLPVVLYPFQADAVRRVAAEWAARADDPDPLPALLITLLLDMGLRLGEVVCLHVDDVDLSNAFRPVVYIRYNQARHQAKRRALVGPPALTNLMQQQLERLGPDETRVVTSSRRCLQYIVERVGKEAGLRRRLTPSTLRWTYALTQFQAGVDPERLRRRLGLARQSWGEVEGLLRALAQQAQ